MDMCGMMLIDMHGVRYANNLLKNLATKRLSAKKQINVPWCVHLIGFLYPSWPFMLMLENSLFFDQKNMC